MTAQIDGATVQLSPHPSGALSISFWQILSFAAEPGEQGSHKAVELLVFSHCERFWRSNLTFLAHTLDCLSQKTLLAMTILRTLTKPWSGEEQTLTCDECFAILEHLANTAIAGADDNGLRIAVQSYLAHCLDYQGYCDERIRALKYWLEKRSFRGELWR